MGAPSRVFFGLHRTVSRWTPQTREMGQRKSIRVPSFYPCPPSLFTASRSPTHPRGTAVGSMSGAPVHSKSGHVSSITSGNWKSRGNDL